MGRPLAEFNYGNGIDGHDHRCEPGKCPAQSRQVQQQQNDADRFALVTFDKRSQYRLPWQADQAQQRCNEYGLPRQDPVRAAQRFPIEPDRKMQPPQDRDEGYAQEQADPIMPIARLH